MRQFEPRITARTITWAPLGLTTAAAIVALAIVGAIGGAAQRGVGPIAGLGLAAIALGAGWFIEDGAADLVGASPRSLRRRHADRLVLGGAAMATALVVVTGVAVAVAPRLRDDLVTAASATQFVAIAMTVVALTALLARRAVQQPALVAAATAAASYAAWSILASSVATATAWALIALGAGAAGFAAGREPLPR